ncbi:hypothetical protein BGW80DRAFT_1252627 [Lactifluus volemus]|nr:hypothetical protein BGW80DRAFT_1252627 [Lactifluus volemus]
MSRQKERWGLGEVDEMDEITEMVRHVDHVDAISRHEDYAWPRWTSRQKERKGIDELDGMDEMDEITENDGKRGGGWTCWTRKPKTTQGMGQMDEQTKERWGVDEVDEMDEMDENTNTDRTPRGAINPVRTGAGADAEDGRADQRRDPVWPRWMHMTRRDCQLDLMDEGLRGARSPIKTGAGEDAEKAVLTTAVPMGKNQWASWMRMTKETKMRRDRVSH